MDKRQHKVKVYQVQFEKEMRLVGNAVATVHNYSDTITKVLSEFPKKMRPHEFHWGCREKYIKRRVEKGYKPQSAERDVEIMSTFWRWMIDREITDYNPWRKPRAVPKLLEPLLTPRE